MWPSHTDTLNLIVLYTLSTFFQNGSYYILFSIYNKQAATIEGTVVARWLGETADKQDTIVWDISTLWVAKAQTANIDSGDQVGLWTRNTKNAHVLFQ